MKIAFVDDEAWHLQLFEKAIQTKFPDKSVEATTYLYPKQATEFARDITKFDKIIIDHRLGGINGANLARRVLKIGVPVIMTSCVIPDNFKGMTFYIEKSKLFRDLEEVLKIKPQAIKSAVEISVLSECSV